MGTGREIKHKGIFITATDTDVGKTVATAVLGILLQNKDLKVGVMKPIQCAGEDASFLKGTLGLSDSLREINPYFFFKAVSPHAALADQKKSIDPRKIIQTARKLQLSYDMLLIEGAGGLLVPLSKDYLIADLIRAMNLPVVIVSRLGLGTINHTLLTIEQARYYGLDVLGVLFNEKEKIKKGIPEKTNPAAIKKFGKVNILGTIPYLKDFKKETILKSCRSIDLKSLVCPRSRVRNWEKDDQTTIWHPFTQMQDWQNDHPLVIEEARGCCLKSTEGRWYLDGVSSLWVNVHGHRHKMVDKALKNQINRVSHSTLLGLSNTPSIELAKRLIAIAPKGLAKVFYSDSGSTAVEIAIKIAYQYWQNIGKKRKRKILHFSESYHGDTLGSVSVGGIDLFHQIYKDLIFKAVKIDSPWLGQKSLEKLENYLKKFHSSTAALVCEPLIQAAGGMLVWPKGSMKRIAHLCKKYEVILIADEVATGFGRTGKMFACEHESIKPDILCLAKGLTAGYLPLAATLTTQKIYDGFLFPYKDKKTFFHGHTYTGNSLCCRAAMANLDVFKKEKTLRKLPPKIQYLRTQLQRFRKLGCVGDIRQLGLMVGIELIKDKRKKIPYLWEEQVGVRVCQKVREKGLILRPLGNVIVLMPPLAISKTQIKEMCNITFQAIYGITENE